MEFDEHEEEQEEEMDMAAAAAAAENHPPGYEPFGNSSRSRMTAVTGGEGGSTARKIGSVKYRECLKNHAVNLGGHALDGCCEFMAAGEDGTLDGLKCAACNCHRNFHRKETDGGGGGVDGMFQNHQISPYYRAAPPAGYLQMNPQVHHHRPLALPAASAGGGGGGYSREEEDMSNPSSSGGGSGTRKRFRTKFTAEQKEKMLGFAETLGWRIQKHDEGAVEEFCAETGVRRHVLKVWMHNNKHTLGKKP